MISWYVAHILLLLLLLLLSVGSKRRDCPFAKYAAAANAISKYGVFKRKTVLLNTICSINFAASQAVGTQNALCSCFYFSLCFFLFRVSTSWFVTCCVPSYVLLLSL